jgi:hypothetical protein
VLDKSLLWLSADVTSVGVFDWCLLFSASRLSVGEEGDPFAPFSRSSVFALARSSRMSRDPLWPGTMTCQSVNERQSKATTSATPMSIIASRGVLPSMLTMSLSEIASFLFSSRKDDDDAGVGDAAVSVDLVVVMIKKAATTERILVDVDIAAL